MYLFQVFIVFQWVIFTFLLMINSASVLFSLHKILPTHQDPKRAGAGGGEGGKGGGDRADSLAWDGATCCRGTGSEVRQTMWSQFKFCHIPAISQGTTLGLSL